MITDVSEEPTYEQAADRFDRRGTAQRPVRPRRVIEIIYRENADGSWTATSPQLRRLQEQGRCLLETRRLVEARLDGWLDPEVVVRPVDYPLPERVATALPSLLSINDHVSGLLRVTAGGVLGGRRHEPLPVSGRISRRMSA